MFLLSSNEMKKLDKIAIDFYKISERVLMENAGKSAAKYFLNLFRIKKIDTVGILAGKGNNGGDAFVVARYLNQKKVKVKIFLLCKKEDIKSKSAFNNLESLISLNISIVEITNSNNFNKVKINIENCSVLIDGIFGIGLKNQVKGIFKEIINYVNFLNKPVYSLDIPSGLNADTGQICGVAINAFSTVTFEYPKLGHYIYPCSDYVGILKVLDIGIPFQAIDNIYCNQNLITLDYIRKNFLIRSKSSHKGTSGHLIVFAGFSGKVGAAILSSYAAMRSGAGLVSLYLPESLNNMILSSSELMEVMTFGLSESSKGCVDNIILDKISDLLVGKRCIVFGPGMGKSVLVIKLLKKLILNFNIPIIIDADGLNIISDNLELLLEAKAPLILTPHFGEMSRLTNKTVDVIKSDPILIAKNFAKTFKINLILKGPNTIIIEGCNNKVFVNTTGNSGMASGGMGDVLSGMIGSFIVQGYPINLALKFAVFIHGKAGDSLAKSKCPFGYLASDLVNKIPEEIKFIFSK